MPQLTILIGVLLIVMSVAIYIVRQPDSITVFIPAIIGLVIGGLGALALAKPNWRKHVMHVVAGLALLLTVGLAKNLLAFIAYLAGRADAVERPFAAFAQATTCVLMALLLIASIASFIKARNARSGGADVAM